MYGIQNGSNTIWLQLNAIILASKNRRKEPGHSGYFSPVLRKMYITLIFISETTINICLFFFAYCCLSNDPIVFKNRSVQSSLLTNYSDKTTLFRAFS